MRVRGARLARRIAMIAVMACAGVALRLSGQASDAQNDWPTYGHDAGSTRFSALRQINTMNVGQLKLAWTYHTAAGTVPAAPATAPQGDAPPAGGGGGR